MAYAQCPPPWCILQEELGAREDLVEQLRPGEEQVSTRKQAGTKLRTPTQVCW